MKHNDEVTFTSNELVQFYFTSLYNFLADQGTPHDEALKWANAGSKYAVDELFEVDDNKTEITTHYTQGA